MLEGLELRRFEALVGQEFDLLLEAAEPITLRLTEARQVGELSAKQAADLGKRTPFSLVFKGPPELYMPQGIRTLRNQETGELALFLVQLEQTAAGSLFEVVFT